MQRSGVLHLAGQYSRASKLCVAEHRSIKAWGSPILDFPYMFDDVDESMSVIQSDMWKELDSEFEQATGVKPLLWYSTGSNAVGNSKHPIETPEDF